MTDSFRTNKSVPSKTKMNAREFRQFILNLALGLAGVNLSYLTAFLLTFNGVFFERTVNQNAGYRMLLIICNLLFLAVYLLSKRIERNPLHNYLAFLILYMGLILFLQAYEFSRVFHLSFLTLLFIYQGAVNSIGAAKMIDNLFRSRDEKRRLLVVGETFDDRTIEFLLDRTSEEISTEIYFFGNRETGSRLKDSFETNRSQLSPESSVSFSCGGATGAVEEFLALERADEIILQAGDIPPEEAEKILSCAEHRQIGVCVLPPLMNYLAARICQTENWRGIPVISISHSKLAVMPYRVVKRALDIMISLVFLAFMFPICLIIIAPLISGTSRGSVFFRQFRKGYRQQPFVCYKFRTMNLGFEDTEAVQARPQDPRVTLIGRVLRKTSLDELPQFINVLRGEMSIVGPRPHMVEHDEFYDKLIERYNVRFAAKPGITGWAQVNGLRGATVDPRRMEKRIEYDLWYIKNWSPWLDLKIIAMTAIALMRGDKNAY